MSMTNVIPELWSKEMVELLQNTLQAAQVCNVSIPAELMKKGQTLHISGAGEVAVADYDASANITFEDPTDSTTEMTVDFDKYFALKIEDDEKLQAGIDWESAYTRRGTYKLRNAFDIALMGEYTNAGIDSYETGTTAWQFTTATGADVPTFFANLNRLLDDANADRIGRYLIAPPSAVEAFTLWGANKATGWGDSVTQSGLIANMFGIDVYMSNNCVTASTTVHGLAGVKGDGIAMAMQVDPSRVETLRLEGRFADGIRGRMLGGVKTYRPAITVDVNFNTTTIA